MNVNYLFSLVAVLLLFALAYLGVKVPGGQLLFGIIIPYVAFIAFLAGFFNRVMGWGRSAVPFRIPTTCGQQMSLPWIKQNKIDNPTTTWGVIARMFF